MKRKLMLFVAMSLDGYIAKPDGNIDFLSLVETPGEDYGYADFLSGIDTIIWGRKTFDKVLSMTDETPHRDKKVYVCSRTRTGHHGHVTYHADVVKLVKELKQEKGKNIYCDGGSEMVAELLRHSLIDRIIVSIIPHLAGDGIKLFQEGLTEQKLKFIKSITYPSALVQLWYDIINQEPPDA